MNALESIKTIKKRSCKMKNETIKIISTSWVTYETMIKYINMLKEVTKEEDLKNKLEGIL